MSAGCFSGSNPIFDFTPPNNEQRRTRHTLTDEEPRTQRATQRLQKRATNQIGIPIPINKLLNYTNLAELFVCCISCAIAQIFICRSCDFDWNGPHTTVDERPSYPSRPTIWHDLPPSMFDRAHQASNRSAREIADSNNNNTESPKSTSTSSPSSSSRKVKRSMSSHAGPTPFHRRISYIPRDAKEWRPKFKWHIYDNQGR